MARIKRRPSVFSPRKLRALREIRGLGIEEAARLASQATGQKMTARAWHYWEAGKSGPTCNRLEALADFFNRPVSAFFENRVSRRAAVKRIAAGAASEAAVCSVPERIAKRQS